VYRRLQRAMASWAVRDAARERAQELEQDHTLLAQEQRLEQGQVEELKQVHGQTQQAVGSGGQALDNTAAGGMVGVASYASTDAAHDMSGIDPAAVCLGERERVSESESEREGVRRSDGLRSSVLAVRSHVQSWGAQAQHELKHSLRRLRRTGLVGVHSDGAVGNDAGGY
jgi:hypothetical protein